MLNSHAPVFGEERRVGQEHRRVWYVGGAAEEEVQKSPPWKTSGETISAERTTSAAHRNPDAPCRARKNSGCSQGQSRWPHEGAPDLN